MGDYRDSKPRMAPSSQPEPEKRPPRPLTKQELAKAMQTRADIHAHMPEMIPIIKEFQEAGMIDGWRSVTFTKVDDDGTV